MMAALRSRDRSRAAAPPAYKLEALNLTLHRMMAGEFLREALERQDNAAAFAKVALKQKKTVPLVRSQLKKAVSTE